MPIHFSEEVGDGSGNGVDWGFASSGRLLDLRDELVEVDALLFWSFAGVLHV